TIKGYRRRGYTPESISNFCEMIGISKQDSVIDVSVLEDDIRDDLNKSVLRKNVVLDPIRVSIKAMQNHHLDVPNHPQDPEFG
ncbi:glutamine--tRNA ligase, partial [Francisella tularensis subsp. holarctica]|nr:glutamine--tRNA ligase [Francisella tularensis subsp. holarctica]